jgi:hypothetical protein
VLDFDVRRHMLLACSGTFLVSCASVSTSETHAYRLGTSEFEVSARAERGATADQLFIVINGTDVASGPFGPEQAAGTTLRGVFHGVSVEAHCGHRWRPGVSLEAWRSHRLPLLSPAVWRRSFRTHLLAGGKCAAV